MKRALGMVGTVIMVVGFIANPVLASEETSFNLIPEKKRVLMGLGYGGETIKFHGTLPQKGSSLIVKVESENNPPMKLVRKGRVVFFWMSVKQFEMEGIPFQYKILCSGNLNDILSQDLRTELNLGYEALKKNVKLKLLKGKASDDDTQVVLDGFLKMKEKLGLYEVVEKAITIKDDQAFTFAVNFSDRAVEGNYRVEGMALKDGIMVGKAHETINIEKIGIARWLTNLANHHGALYGVMAVVVAISVGFLAGFVFKGKGGH